MRGQRLQRPFGTRTTAHTPFTPTATHHSIYISEQVLTHTNSTASANQFLQGACVPTELLPRQAMCMLFGLLSLLLAGSARSAGWDRSDAFGSAWSQGCRDKFPDCIDRALDNGCIYNSFSMRSYCPATCLVQSCTNEGSVKVGRLQKKKK